MAAAALAATLSAHAMSGADLTLTPVAPATWLTLVMLSLLAQRPGRRGAFRTWGVGRVAMTLVVGQVAMHALLHAAPWSFGFVGHEHVPLLAASALWWHAAAAGVLTVMLCFGQRILQRAVGVLRRLLAVTRRPAGARPVRRIVPLAVRRPRECAGDPRSSRGPPAVVTAA